METALLHNSVMTLGPSPQKISAVLPNSSCVLLTSHQSGNISAHSSPLKGSSPQRAHQTTITSRGPIMSSAGLLETSSQHGSMSSASSTTSSSSSGSSSDLIRCKRRINFTHLSYAIPHAQPVAVARRNARERNRVKQVNNGFSTLRQHIPFTARNKKMSKVETLKCAVEYIRGLQQLLDENSDDAASTSSMPSPQEHQMKEEMMTTDEGTVVVAAALPSIDTATTTVLVGAGSDHGYYSSPETVVVLSDTTSTNNNHFQSQQQMFQQPLPHHHHHHHHLQPASLSPPCSSDPASSPTPSFASEESSYHPTSSAVYEQTYDNYEPMSPEDEELLDVISWWQQSQ